MEREVQPLSIPTIDGATVLLRAFAPSDLGLIEAASAESYIPLITSVPAMFRPSEGLAFIERQAERARAATGYSMVIVDRATDRAVGQVGLWLADLSSGRATLGYWM